MGARGPIVYAVEAICGSGAVKEVYKPALVRYISETRCGKRGSLGLGGA